MLHTGSHLDLASAFEATVILSTAAALALGAFTFRAAGQADAESVAPSSAPSSAPRLRARLLAALCHPLAQLLLVCALLFANQILFDAYVVRVHGGDPGFVGRYVGWGWFAIATNDPLVRFVASHAGDGRWLSPTVLRVQAFLELPFALFAYLAVARLLGARVVRRLVAAPMVVAASVSFTVTFCLVELLVPNPWTGDDLVIRWISAAITPGWILLTEKLRAGVEPADDDRPSGVLGLLTFLAGAGAIAYLVLAVYDAFLLYNLAHLSRYARGLAVAIGIASGAAWAAPRVDRWFGADRPPVIDAASSSLATFTTLFFVPSLSLRYWGNHPTAIASGVALVLLSAIAGTVAAARRMRADGASHRIVGALRLGTCMAAGLALGGIAATFAIASPAASAIPELVLAKGSLAFLVVAVVAMRAVEILLGGSPRRRGGKSPAMLAPP